MLIIIIRTLLAIGLQSACHVGTDADYYAWVDAHADYRVAWSLESRILGDYWLMQSGADVMLFKFAKPIEDTVSSGASHGACFRKMN